jgi:very-short-patch-repair endonuclease
MILPGTGRGTVRRANGGGGGSLRKPAVYAARKLRRALSPPEAVLWTELRGKKLGHKVRRQHPIGPYIADFFVRETNLVIEVDGIAHDYGDRPARDLARDEYMASRGYRIIRLAAADVMNNLQHVLRYIAEQVRNPLHHPSDGSPPRPGEEQ